MKILLTGHKGYIGSVMTPMLLRAGHEVVGLDCDFYERCTFSGLISNIPEIRKDIRDVEKEDVEGFDAVIHLAALSNDPLGNLNPELTYDINYRASVNLAGLSKEAGVPRFLFSSSCSLYGSSGDKLVDETAEFSPVTPYGHSKVLVEQEVSPMADGKFSPVFLRNATAYGFSPRLRFDLVVNNLTAWAFTTGNALIKSDGSPWRPLVHVEDICRAFLAVLQTPRERTHNQAMNVGSSSENYQIRDVADIVKSIVPGSDIQFASGGSPDLRNYRVDFTKINRLLPEFKPTWTVRLGAEHLYQEYLRSDLKVDDFEGPRYKRIDHIGLLMNDGLLGHDLRWAKAEALT